MDMASDYFSICISSWTGKSKNSAFVEVWWLVRSSPDRGICMRALAGDIALYSVLGKTLNFHSVSLHRGRITEYRRIKAFLAASCNTGKLGISIGLMG